LKIQHERHLKGWGYEDWIVNTELYCGKILHVNKGKKCSLHFHEVKTETMHISSGSVIMRYGKEVGHLIEVTLTKGQSFHIVPGLFHQFEALEDSDIFEFSTQHFEEDSKRVMKGD